MESRQISSWGGHTIEHDLDARIFNAMAATIPK
jgi:hypothetical protein